MRKQLVSGLLTATSLMLGLAATAHGQHYQPFGPLDIHHDLQFFAPPIIDEYGDEPVAPNYGWFADYSRAMLHMSRPESVASSFQEDDLYGNIWDVGYMTEENHGWLVSIVHLGRANVFNLTAVTDIQGNNFTLVDNLNAGTYAGAEINKTFRVHVGEKGTYFEPFGGLRYAEFEELLNQETLVFDDPANPMVETGTGTAGVFQNTMIGGQFGMRSYVRRGHWVLSGEARSFAMANFQELSVRQTQIITTADGAGGFNVQNPVINQVDESYNEFVVGGELRVEAAYQFTRDIRGHVGMELLTLGRGIGRGFDQTNLTGAADNDQGVTYLGYFIGIQVNR